MMKYYRGGGAEFPCECPWHMLASSCGRPVMAFMEACAVFALQGFRFAHVLHFVDDFEIETHRRSFVLPKPGFLLQDNTSLSQYFQG